MDPVTAATLKVIIDGQAVLYSMQLTAHAELLGEPVTEKLQQEWQDDWKQETAELIQELLNEE